MALARIPYRLGREPRVVAAAGDAAALARQEDHAGAQAHQLPLGVFVDPYETPGIPPVAPSPS